jgi:LmbE family N-acetylglucosaminyl deacetylase
LAEADAAAKVLNVAQRITLDFPNRRLFDTFEARLALAKYFRRARPSMVIGMEGKTPLASPDHWQAMQITDAAVFYSRLSKWDHHFEGLSPHTIDHQVYYRLSLEPNASVEDRHQITMDIGPTLEAKLAAIRCYKTQFPEEKAHVFTRVESLARAVGLAAGFAAGEIFSLARPIGTKDLVKTVRFD